MNEWITLKPLACKVIIPSYMRGAGPETTPGYAVAVNLVAIARSRFENALLVVHLWDGASHMSLFSLSQVEFEMEKLLASLQ